MRIREGMAGRKPEDDCLGNSPRGWSKPIESHVGGFQLGRLFPQMPVVCEIDTLAWRCAVGLPMHTLHGKAFAYAYLGLVSLVEAVIAEFQMILLGGRTAVEGNHECLCCDFVRL